MTSAFTFNNDYRDFAQVEPFLAEFLTVYEEVARNGFAYNDSFIDRIPAIANKAKRGPSVGTHEEAAIYMLQGLKRLREQEAKVAALLADGYEHIDALDVPKRRFAHIVIYSTDRSCTWAEFVDARVLAAGGEPYAVMPKGKRTYGYGVDGGRRVLARA